MTRLLPLLWSTAHRDCLGTLNVTRSVIFEHNFPKMLFVSTVLTDPGVLEVPQPVAGDQRDMQRLAGKDLDSNRVVDLLCSKRCPGDDSHIGQVMYIESRAISEGVKHASGDRKKSVGSAFTASASADTATGAVAVFTQYFTRRGLRYFMQGPSSLTESRPGSEQTAGGGSRQPPHASTYSDERIAKEVRLLTAKSGLLLRLPETGGSNELIQAVWSPRITMCEKLRNINQVQDATKSVFDRYSTFDGPANITTRKFLAPAIQASVQDQIAEILRRIATSVPGKMVRNATLYFQADTAGVVWFMFATAITLVPVPTPESAPLERASRLAATIVERAAAESGRIDAGPRPLSLVEFSEADVQRDFMLLHLTTAADALAMASASASRRRHLTSAAAGHTMEAAPAFVVPAESKLALLAGLTRGATRDINRTKWNELASTELAVASGIASTRTREDFARVPLHAKCFTPDPIENRCLDRPPTADGGRSRADLTKSSFARPMTWLRGGAKDLLAHRYSNRHVTRRQDHGLPQHAPAPHDAVSAHSDDGPGLNGTGTHSRIGTPAAFANSRSSRRNSVDRRSSKDQQVLDATTRSSVPLVATSRRESDKPAAATYRDMLRMASLDGSASELCRNCEHAEMWLDELRSAGTSHFQTQPKAMLAVSIPPVLIPHAGVSKAVADHLLKCDFEEIDIDAAVEADFAVRRVGIVDELSYHHVASVATGGDLSLLPGLRCFGCRSLRAVLRAVSTSEEFYDTALAPLLETHLHAAR